MAQKKTVAYESAFNRYELRDQIGSGGSGTVYKATDVEGERVAVKVIDPTKTTSTKLKRFQNEIRFCEINTHRNIIKVLDHGRGPHGEPFYVMPLYGTTLHQLMAKRIPPTAVLPLFAQLLDGAEAAHLKHVVHRDLKPQNILLNESDTDLVVADFGIASFEEEDLYTAVETQKAERLASFQYASPEQRARGRDITLKADVFALGLILNEMFTSEILQGTSFKAIASVAPDYAYLDAVVDMMVRQDPLERPSIADIKRELIAHRERAISLQKIDRLTREVVPESKIDDPLIANPIKLVSVDYTSGEFVFKLSALPTADWISGFYNLLSVTSFLGCGPEKVRFSGVHAVLNVSGLQEQSLPQQVAYFQNWIATANQSYAQLLQERLEEERKLKQKQLETELGEERKRQRILSNIKW
jgi:serine/threonine protein kinase